MKFTKSVSCQVPTNKSCLIYSMFSQMTQTNQHENGKSPHSKTIILRPLCRKRCTILCIKYIENDQQEKGRSFSLCAIKGKCLCVISPRHNKQTTYSRNVSGLVFHRTALYYNNKVKMADVIGFYLCFPSFTHASLCSLNTLIHRRI